MLEKKKIHVSFQMLAGFLKIWKIFYLEFFLKNTRFSGALEGYRHLRQNLRQKVDRYRAEVKPALKPALEKIFEVLSRVTSRAFGIFGFCQ